VRISSITRLVAVAALAVFGLSAIPAGASKTPASGIPKGPIKVGAITSLSGPLATFGVSQISQWKVIVKLANQAGGIDGHKIDLITLNDGGNAATSLNDARQLVSDHVADVLYGGLFPASTLPYFNAHKTLVVMLLGTTNPYANGKLYPYTFPIYPTFCQDANAMLLAAKEDNQTNVGLLTDDTQQSASLAACVKSSPDAAGLNLIGPVEFDDTSVDVTPQLQQLKSEGATSILLLPSSSINYVFSGLVSMDWNPPIYAGAAADFYTSSIGTLSSPILVNCAWPIVPGQSLPAGLSKLFKAVTAQIPASTSTQISTYYSDDLGLFMLAVEKTHSLNSAVLANAIQNFKNVSYTSPTWTYTFTPTDHDGFPAKGLAMCPLTAYGPYDYSEVGTS
jgi:branched-chain amino acid transport system substrate-binding protein